MTGGDAEATASGLLEILDVTIVDHRCVTRMAFPGVPEHVRTVRDFIMAALGDDHPCAELAVQMVSELATNSVTHSFSAGPDGTIWVMVSWTPDDVRIEVEDAGGDTVPRAEDRGPDADGGRGLRLVGKLADEWGYRDSETSRTVWFAVTARDHEPS